MRWSLIFLIGLACFVISQSGPSVLSTEAASQLVGGAWGPCETISPCAQCAVVLSCVPDPMSGCRKASGGTNGCSQANRLTCADTNYTWCSQSGSGDCGVSEVYTPCPPPVGGICNLPAPNVCAAGGTSPCDGCL